MLLIADSGSTKADWAWVAKDGETSYVHTAGYNPVVHPKELFYGEMDRLTNELLPGLKPKEVHYYGAGCWDYKRKQVIQDRIQQTWPEAKVLVMHDLLGAARAACGHNPGIACILGTGSNTCSYDGEDVSDNVTNLGYMLGDEGSGSHLGKALLRSYFYRELDDDLTEAFEKFSKVDKSTILDKVYDSDIPNTYLASFTRFMGEHQEHPLIQKIVFTSFAEFLDRHVRKYRGHLDVPVSFIGSIAFHFKPILLAAMHERDLKVGRFVHKPIEALADFHRSAESLSL
jgi:N-acetylglucosamine kinase-like BadF-type ATPase